MGLFLRSTISGLIIFSLLKNRQTTLETPLLTESDIRQRIWMELQRATNDRHHEWRTPVLATVDTDGIPQARTAVLRAADKSLNRLQIYTDSRSPKVAELFHHPHATLVFWSKRLSWQLRVQTLASVQVDGSELDTVWAKVSQSAAAGDYLSANVPGTVMIGDEPTRSPETALSHTHNLAIITFQIEQIDWLELARTGHRRATFTSKTWDWRVP